VVLRLGFVLLLAASCTKRVPPQRLPERASLAVAAVLDPESQGEAEEVPGVVFERLGESADSRNLLVERVPLSALGGQKISGERARAMGRSVGAPWRVLIETRAVFFSRMEGQYRWTVGVRVSASRASDGASAVEEFTLPAVMQFDHQKGPAAVEAVADEIARRAALVLDSLIAAPATNTARPEPVEGRSIRPTSIYFVMVDRFSNGDRSNDAEVELADPQAFHGGDLAGATQRLDWL
jgi:hypothetical protein